MMVFAKENSVLGRGRRHEQRHTGLIWPPYRPFFTALSGSCAKSSVFCHVLSSFWRTEAPGSPGCSLLPFTLHLYPVLFTFYIWNISDSWTGQEFAFTAGPCCHSVLHFPSYSCSGLTLPHHLGSDWEIPYLQSPPRFSPVWVRQAASVWPWSTWLFL